MSLSEFLNNYTPQSGWGTFFTAAFGAFAGAFAASLSQNKRAIIAELNALSAAHALCVSIANRFLALKKQHVRPMKDDFDRISAAYRNHQTMERQSGVRVPFAYVANLKFLSRSQRRPLR
jgi:hypothetical protein